MPNDDISLATTYSNIALIEKDLGNFQNAKVCMEKCIKIKINKHGQNHILLATSYSNLALIEKDLGIYDSALLHIKQCFQIQTQ